AIGVLELVSRAVRVLVRGGPLTQVGLGDLLPVQHNAEDRAVARDLDLVPFAGGAGRVEAGSQNVVDRAAVMPLRLHPAQTVQDLDLDAGVHRVLHVGPADEDAAVDPRVDL